MDVSKKTTDTVVPPVPPVDPVVPPVPPVDPVVPPAPTPDVNSGVDPAALPQEGDVTVATTIPAETSNADGSLPSETLPQGETILTPEEIAANQAAADAAFKAANDGAEERIAKEESIPSMTPEELQEEF